MESVDYIKAKEAFGRLLGIMDDLRAKCPWDRKQTLESLRILTIEETYELAEAIAGHDLPGIKEELGDLLLHIVFYAKIGNEKQAFDIEKVITDLCEKLIERHPHIYGEVIADTEEQVKENWEKIKLKSKKEGKKSVLGGVPSSLPALVKAYRMQDKAAQVGFEWEYTEQVMEKIKEELGELEEARVTLSQAKIEEEFGDVLFALVNYSRYLKIDPELALERSNRKFKARFEYIEQEAAIQQRNMETMTLEEMDGLWNDAKAKGIHG